MAVTSKFLKDGHNSKKKIAENGNLNSIQLKSIDDINNKCMIHCISFLQNYAQ